MKPKTLTLMLCVNAPDNGNHTGRVEGIEFCVPGELDAPIKLESSYWDWGPACRWVDSGKHLKISRRIFPIQGYSTRVGNWCWDAAIVTVETANQILAYLQSQHDRRGNPYWTVDSGWTEIFDAWERKEPIDLQKYIEG